MGSSRRGRSHDPPRCCWACAVARCQALAPMRAADAARLTPTAKRVAGDQDRGRRVTGSMRVPTMHPRPMAAQTAPGHTLGARCRAVAAVMTAAAGIGQGAATAAPHPAASPAGTDSGMLTPRGWPGSWSRIATTLPSTAAPAKPSEAPSSARSGFTLIRTPALALAGPQASGHPPDLRDGRCDLDGVPKRQIRQDLPRWHLAHPDAVGRCRPTGTRNRHRSRLGARRHPIALEGGGRPIGPGPTSRTLEWLFWNTGLLIARVRYRHISGSGQQPRRNCPAARHNLRSGPAHWLSCRLQDCGGPRAAELPSRLQGSGESPAIRARSVPWLHSWLHGLVVVWMFLWPRSRVK